MGLRSLTEQIDTTTSGGRLIFHVFGALGQFERDLIRDRTRAGLTAAAARGRKGGRKPVTAEVLRKARGRPGHDQDCHPRLRGPSVLFLVGGFAEDYEVMVPEGHDGTLKST